MKVLYKISKQAWINLLSTFTLWLIFLVFALSIGQDLRVFYNVLYYLGDAFLISAPIWLMGRYGRWYAVAVIWILSIFLIASALYYRYWGELLPLASVFNTSNWNHFVFQSSWHYINWPDILIIALAIGYTVHVSTFRSSAIKSLRWRVNITAFIASILIWVATVSVDFIHIKRYNKWCNVEYSSKNFFESKFSAYVFSNYEDVKAGIVWYLTKQIRNVITINKKIKLTDEQAENISIALASHPVLTDSIVSTICSANKDKNLILIIVESLNSAYIGHKVNGKSITPVLDSLINEQGTISSLNMQQQTGMGGSSDGQFIYNTGLLPILSGITAQQYENNEYLSLAKILKKRISAEYIVENSAVWNHCATNRAYGYDKLYERKDLQAAGLYESKIGGDAAVLSFAIRKLIKMPRPFFAQIVTLSMHFPFVDEGVPGIDNDDIAMRYYITLNYFDHELGKFIESLKRQNLYDNTVIALASDHDKDIHGNRHHIQPICFIAFNTGFTKHITKRTWQSDVFPTILDIMGVDDSEGYRGLGHSLLSDSIPNRDDAYWLPVRQMSDQIIRSDYFSQQYH